RHRPRAARVRRRARGAGAARPPRQARALASRQGGGGARPRRARAGGGARGRAGGAAGAHGGAAGGRGAHAGGAPGARPHPRGPAPRGGDAGAVRARAAGGAVSGLWRVIRLYPALLRVSFAEAVAYRSEFFVWMLTNTLPLVMLALWSAV